MCRNIFAILSLFAVAVILPINVIYNRKNAQADILGAKDAFILTTPILIYGNITAAHVTLAYIFDFIVLYFLWANYEQIIALRRKVFMSEEYQNALFMRTLLLTEVPKKYRVEDNGLVALMNTLKTQRPIQNATVGRDVGELNKVIKSYNDTVLKLESVLAAYLKNPDRLPSQRPQMKPFKDEKEFAVGKKGKLDAIDYLSSRMQRLEAEIFDARDAIDSRKTLPYGFVSYESAEDCNIVAKAVSERRIRKHGLRAGLAPRPEAIIWENIILTRSGRRNKQFWGNLFFVLMMLLWIVPNAFLGAFLSQLSRIGVLWPPFNTFVAGYPVLFSIVQGVIAPLVTSLIFLVMPMIMRKMSHWQGKVTRTDREMDVTRKLYCFFVFNNVFVFTLFSVVWSIVVQIINIVKTQSDLSFSKVIQEISVAYKISTAVMSASSFWIMYILRVNFGAVLDLLQLVSLLWRGFQRHFMSPTPRQQMLWTAPQSFTYATFYNWLLFYSTIALSFAMVQPLVLLAVTLYFSVDILYKKYGLMYIYVTKAESDGLFWPLLFNSFLFATAFGNVVLFVVVWVQGGWRIAAGMGPLLIIIIGFKLMSNKRHKNRFYFFIPTEKETMEMNSLRTRTNLSDISSLALARKYRNPVIDCKLMVPMIHSKSQHLLSQISDLNSYGEDVDPETAFRAFDHDEEIELGNMSYDRTRARAHLFDDDFHQNRSNAYNQNNNSTDNFNYSHHVPRRRVSPARKSFLAGKFDIVTDEDMNYGHLKYLERDQTPVPDAENPYLNPGGFSSQHREGGYGGKAPDTSNDEMIARALAEDEGLPNNNNGLAPYHTQDSFGSSETFVAGGGIERNPFLNSNSVYNHNNNSMSSINNNHNNNSINNNNNNSINNFYPGYPNQTHPDNPLYGDLHSVYATNSIPELRSQYSSERLVSGSGAGVRYGSGGIGTGDMADEYEDNAGLLNRVNTRENPGLRMQSSRENLLSADRYQSHQPSYPGYNHQNGQQPPNGAAGRDVTRGYSNSSNNGRNNTRTNNDFYDRH